MKKKSLLLSSLAMLVVAVIAFTGATYAWFISGNEPSVEQFEVGVVQSSVVKIGATKPTATTAPAEKDYYFTLPFNTLSGINNASANGTNGWYYNPNDLATPALLDAVTPQYNKTTSKLIFDSGSRLRFNKEPVATMLTPGDPTGTPAVDPTYRYDYTEDTANFIAFDLFFINLHADKLANVAFDADLSKIFIDSSKAYAADLTPAQKELVLSTRMAFVTYTSAGAVDKEIIWEPYKGVVITTAIAGADAGVQGPIDYVSATPANGSTLSPAYTSTPNAGKKMIHLFTLPTYGGVWINSTRLSVYIWIEGNDPRCVSLVSGGMFSVLLQFATELGGEDPLVTAAKALAKAKTDAITEIEDYFYAIDDTQYANWATAEAAMEAIVDEFIVNVNAATTTAAITTLVTNAKVAIDAVSKS